ncbi:FERM and PDZ domain-containing protein 3-like [Oscarella lobularis]|uniref:FERM and PDZ domain-containing protein 3-like n=1 Tax=Oscarella lobularis TaxID=121494 RepID=UPI0033139147
MRTGKEDVENGTVEEEEQESKAKSRSITVNAGPKGFGFVLKGSAPVFVRATSPGGAAEEAGIREGDVILKINEHDVRRDGHEAVVNLIRQSKGKPLTLTLGEDNSVPPETKASLLAARIQRHVADINIDAISDVMEREKRLSEAIVAAAIEEATLIVNKKEELNISRDDNNIKNSPAQASKWEPDDVLLWLEAIRMSHYATLFQTVSGPNLLALHNKQSLYEMGVARKSDVNYLWEEIDKLRQWKREEKTEKPPPPQSVYEWREADVIGWLERLGSPFSDVCSLHIQNHAITGRVLVRMTDEKLKRIGIEDTVLRKRLLHRINLIRFHQEELELRKLASGQLAN